MGDEELLLLGEEKYDATSNQRGGPNVPTLGVGGLTAIALVLGRKLLYEQTKGHRLTKSGGHGRGQQHLRPPRSCKVITDERMVQTRPGWSEQVAHGITAYT